MMLPAIMVTENKSVEVIIDQGMKRDLKMRHVPVISSEQEMNWQVLLLCLRS